MLCSHLHFRDSPGAVIARGCAENLSLNDIAARLNAESVRTSGGAKETATAVKRDSPTPRYMTTSSRKVNERSQGQRLGMRDHIWHGTMMA